MEKRRLIITDLDGTLFGSDKRVSDIDVCRIKEITDKGHLFTIATSRHHLTVKGFLNNLNINCPIITANGSLIYDEANDQVLFQNNIDKNTVREILRLGMNNGFNMLALSANHLYFSKGHPFMERYRRNDEEAMKVCYKTKPVEVDFLSDYDIEDIFQVSVSNPDNEKTKAFFKEHITNDEIEIVITGKGIVVFKPKTSSKASAAQFLLEYYGLPLDNLIVFGDDENDIEIFDYAINSVAMENAKDFIKDRAKYITLSNDNHGVTDALLNIFKL